MTSQADTASKFAPPRSPRGSLLRGLARRPALLTLLAALAVLALASLLLDQTVRLALLLTAAILVAALALRQAAALPLARRRALRRGAALAAAEDDPIPCLLADRAGRPLGRNRAAREVGLDHEELARRLAPHVADPPSLLADLSDTARRGGTASWADPARPQAPRLQARGIDPDTILWRIAQAAPDLPAVGWDTLEGLPIPLMRLSLDGTVLAANRHARDLLPVAAPGTTRLSDLLDGLGRPVGEWVADVAAGRPTSGPQFLRGTGDNRDTIVRVSLTLAPSPDAGPITALLDDVTELKSLEAQFVQSQKMQALGQLAGGVAHDFNNLLTAMTGHSDLLLQRHGQDDPDYADLIQIRQNVNRAAGLVAQLLAYSRKQPMLAETLDLRVVLSDLTHLLNRLVGERVRLTLDHEPTLRFVRADKRHLEQVLMNLVVNARDAMPHGGRIRIETENRRLSGPMTRDRATLPPGDYVLVRVIDQGVGIPPERLPLIFDPFYTTKRPGEGTGLGLSTVYGIVKQSGAYVFVDSEVGQGSTFTLWFPAHDATLPAAPPPPAAAVTPIAQSKAKGRLLLVEDEPGVRAFAARALRLHGHEVEEAGSGEAALERLADPSYAPDLILTDVILPDLDGPTWVREALRDRPGTRVVFMSGYAEDSFAEQKALIEGSGFLPKPFSLSELTEVVERELAPA